MSGTIRILVDGRALDCAPGVPLSQVLSAHFGFWRYSPRLRRPRGMFCGMGLCFECMVKVDGLSRRACLTDTEEGMAVTTERRADDR